MLCKGLCERIGMESSMITHEANGHKATTPAIFPTHNEAFLETGEEDDHWRRQGY